MTTQTRKGSAMRQVSYGLVGFGNIAENRIAKEGFGLGSRRFESKTKCPAKLVGATDVNPKRKKSVEALGVEWFDSYQRMLENDRIDAIFVATDNASHHSIAKTAIEAGKHCVVEKPMATKLDDARELPELAKKRNVSLMVDHMMKQNVHNKQARSLLEEGRIGDVTDICLHMEFPYGSTPAEARSWRCRKSSDLGGPLGDVGSHCFYMAEFLLDTEIKAVSCVHYPRTLDIEVENGAYVKFETQRGVTGSLRVAFSERRGGILATLSNLGYEIYGTDGVLRTYASLFQLSGHEDEPAKVRLEVEDADGVRAYAPSDVENIYQSMIDEHARSVLSNRPLDGTEGLRNLRLIMAARESAAAHGKKIWIT